MKNPLPLAALAGVALLGCSQPTEEDVARTWATSSSAVGVYWEIYEPAAFAHGEHTFEDPACPLTSDDGTVVTIRGECTTRGGERRFGTATITRGAGQALEISLDGYGRSTDLGDLRTTGTASIRALEADLHEFDLDLVIQGGARTHLDYVGTVRGGYDGATTWNGTGTIERSGSAPTGTVTATTVDERLDDTCGGQPVSGQTTIEQAGRTDVITYDGATACDDAHAAAWSVNGVDRGLLAGIGCSASPGRSSGVALGTALLAGLALLARIAHRRPKSARS
ncbi:MAG: hypothetical protein K1X94_06175 [Sandaracinaceae bacterium]|nr:hypothetical protein [Sandaracinaceae bacterium]